MSKSCFIITPLTDTPEWNKKLNGLKEIMYPILTKLGFGIVVDSSEIRDLGNITEQIINHILEDELVIVNLTDLNPNVMYELAVRHSTGKPCVHICEHTVLPFDIKDYRTVFYSDSLDGANRFRQAFEEIVGGIDYTKFYSNSLMHETDCFVKLSKKTESYTSFILGDSSPKDTEEGVFYVTKDDKSTPVDYRNRLVLIAENNTSYSYSTNNFIDLTKDTWLIIEIEHLIPAGAMFVALVKENGERVLFNYNKLDPIIEVDISKISGKYRVEIGITATSKTGIAQIRKVYTA